MTAKHLDQYSALTLDELFVRRDEPASGRVPPRRDVHDYLFEGSTEPAPSCESAGLPVRIRATGDLAPVHPVARGGERMSIRVLRLATFVLCLGAAVYAPPHVSWAQVPDDVDRNDAARKAWEEQKLGEKYDALQKIALDFLKGASQDDTGKLVDVAITAASLGFPPAGIALGVIKALYFNMKTSPNPVVETITVLNSRITAAENDIKALQGAVEQLQNNDYKIENRRRLDKYRDRRDGLAGVKDRLVERPQGQAAQSLINEALRQANRYRPDNEPDEDLWYWSDIRVDTNPATGQLRSSRLPKRFEPWILEGYLQSLALLVAAVEHGGYSPSLRPELERHVAFLTENPSGRENEWPMPLPARMEARISCDTRVPTMQYPDRDGVCRNTMVCDEAFSDRTGHYVGRRSHFLSHSTRFSGNALSPSWLS